MAVGGAQRGRPPGLEPLILTQEKPRPDPVTPPIRQGRPRWKLWLLPLDPSHAPNLLQLTAFWCLALPPDPVMPHPMEAPP